MYKTSLRLADKTLAGNLNKGGSLLPVRHHLSCFRLAAPTLQRGEASSLLTERVQLVDDWRQNPDSQVISILGPRSLRLENYTRNSLILGVAWLIGKNYLTLVNSSMSKSPGSGDAWTYH